MSSAAAPLSVSSLASLGGEAAAAECRTVAVGGVSACNDDGGENIELPVCGGGGAGDAAECLCSSLQNIILIYYLNQIKSEER